MPDPVDLKRVLELDQAATPGPWAWNVDDERIFGTKIDGEVTESLDAPMCGVVFHAARWPVQIPDADLIAVYRDAAPAMARTLKELREQALAAKAHPHPSNGAYFTAVILRVTAPPDDAQAT